MYIYAYVIIKLDFGNTTISTAICPHYVFCWCFLYLRSLLIGFHLDWFPIFDFSLLYDMTYLGVWLCPPEKKMNVYLCFSFCFLHHFLGCLFNYIKLLFDAISSFQQQSPSDLSRLRPLYCSLHVVACSWLLLLLFCSGCFVVLPLVGCWFVLMIMTCHWHFRLPGNQPSSTAAQWSCCCCRCYRYCCYCCCRGAAIFSNCQSLAVTAFAVNWDGLSICGRLCAFLCKSDLRRCLSTVSSW